MACRAGPALRGRGYCYRPGLVLLGSRWATIASENPFVKRREVMRRPSADVVPKNAEVRDRVRHAEPITPANAPRGNHMHVFALNLGDAQLS